MENKVKPSVRHFDVISSFVLQFFSLYIYTSVLLYPPSLDDQIVLNVIVFS